MLGTASQAGKRFSWRGLYTGFVNPTTSGDQMTARPPESVSQAWLVRVRFLVAAGAALIVIAVEFGGDRALPALQVLLLLGLSLASNLAFWARLRGGLSVSEGTLAAFLTLDIAVLTAALAVTGGASNPFSSAYLLYVAIGALLLPPGWTWSLVAVAIVAYSGLFWPAITDEHAGHRSMSTHLAGMWVAFVVVGPVVAYMVTQLRKTLAGAEEQLAESRRRQVRSEKLSALATLSAGAAHELATPLGTIAVVAKELERRQLDPELTEDARLIRAEIDRCTEILSQLAVDVGAGIGEAARTLRVGDLTDDLDSSSAGVQIDASPGLMERKVTLPRRLSVQALRGLLANARQASPDDRDVEIHVRGDDDRLVIVFEDHGCGMDEEVQRRAGEPFFTTKAAGDGMGLGIFFARSVIEHLGGELEIDSRPGLGTLVTVRIPWTQQPADSDMGQPILNAKG